MPIDYEFNLTMALVANVTDEQIYAQHYAADRICLWTSNPNNNSVLWTERLDWRVAMAAARINEELIAQRFMTTPTTTTRR